MRGFAPLPPDHYHAVVQVPPRRRHDSVDDLGGLLSRFEAPLCMNDYKSIGTVLPPRAVPPPHAIPPSFSVKVKTIKGRVYTIRCQPDVKGMELKSLIRPETALVVGQRLICNGKDVDDSLTLQQQGITGSSVIHRLRLFEYYVPKYNPNVPFIEMLRFECENGQSFELALDGGCSIAEIRHKIDVQFNMLMDYSCRLFYKGVALGEKPYAGSQLLDNYGIGNEETILVFIIRGASARN